MSIPINTTEIHADRILNENEIIYPKLNEYQQIDPKKCQQITIFYITEPLHLLVKNSDLQSKIYEIKPKMQEKH